MDTQSPDHKGQSAASGSFGHTSGPDADGKTSIYLGSDHQDTDKDSSPGGKGATQSASGTSSTTSSHASSGGASASSGHAGAGQGSDKGEQGSGAKANGHGGGSGFGSGDEDGHGRRNADQAKAAKDRSDADRDRDVSDLRQEFADLRAHFDRTLKAVGQAAYERGTEVVGAVRDRAGQASSGVGTTMEDAYERAREQAQCAKKTVREHPTAALAAAALVGIIVGLVKSSPRR